MPSDINKNEDYSHNAFSRMYDNGKKHILRRQAAVLSFEFWVLSFSVNELLVFHDRKPGNKVLNDGEYCVSFKQWEALCQKASFKKIYVSAVPDFEWYKVLIAVK